MADDKAPRGTSRWVAALTQDTSLSLATRVLGAHLATARADWRTGTGIWCAVSTMCECTGLSRATVHRALSALLEGGWIVVTKRPPGRPIHYALDLDRGAGAPVQVELDDDGAPGPGGDETGGTNPQGGCLTDETPPLGCGTMTHHGGPVDKAVDGPVDGPVESCGKLWKAIGACRTSETGGSLTSETGGVSRARHKLSPKLTQELLEEEVAGREHDDGVDHPRASDRDAGAPQPSSDRQTSTQGAQLEDGAPSHTTGPVDMERRALERVAHIRSVLLRDDDEWPSDEDAAKTGARLRDLAPLVPEHYQDVSQGRVCWAVSTWLYRWHGVPLATGTWTVLLQPVLSNLPEDDAFDYILWQIIDESARAPVDWTCNADVQRVWTSVRSARARARWRAEIHREREWRGEDWRSDNGNAGRWARNVTFVLRALRALGLDGAHTHTRSTP